MVGEANALAERHVSAWYQMAPVLQARIDAASKTNIATRLLSNVAENT